MKILSYLASFVLVVSVISLNATTVIQCGDDPDGSYECSYITYDDGSDCTIVDNEGAPGGIVFFGCE
jgi:hypothetical protein